MKFTQEQYAQALYEALQEVHPKDYDRVIDNFLTILKYNGDLSHYEQIVDAVESYEKLQRGIKDVQVTTARELPNQKILGSNWAITS